MRKLAPYLAILLALIGAPAITHAQTVGPGQTVSPISPFRYNGTGDIKPINASSTLTLPALPSAACIGTNASGTFINNSGSCGGGGGGGTTTTINGVAGPTFTFTINNTSSPSSITTSSAQLFLNLLRYTSGTDINVAADGTINFVNTPGFITAAITSINGATSAAQSIVGGTGVSVSTSNPTTTVTNTGVTSLTAGTGISVSNPTGTVAVTNTGVTSFNGATGTVLFTATSTPPCTITNGAFQFNSSTFFGCAAEMVYSTTTHQIKFTTISGSGSQSVGGGVNITGTNATTSPLVIYDNQAAEASGQAVQTTCDTAFNTFDCVIVRGLATSTTAFAVQSSAVGKGSIKINHNQPTDGESDANASGLSIELDGTSTAAQGIFIDAPTSTTGNLLEIRNGGAIKFRVTSVGNGSFTGTLATNGITNTGVVTSTDFVDTNVTSSLVLNDVNGKLGKYAGASCGTQGVTAISATGTVTCSTFATSTGGGTGSGNGNLFVSPTSSVVAGQFPFYTISASSTVSATSSITQDATGTIWINTGSTKNPVLVVGTSSNVASNIVFGVVTTSTLFTVDVNGNLAAPSLGSTTQNCLITSSTAGQIGITACPNIPLTLLTTTSTNTTVSATTFASIATSTFTVSTSTNVLVVVAGVISATGTANTCVVTVFIDGVNQDAFGNGLSNSGVTLSSQMDASFSYISSALASGSHTINLEVKATGVAAPSCAPSISQFAVNTISGTVTSSGGSGTVGPGVSKQVAVFNTTTTVTSFPNYVYNDASNTLYLLSPTTTVGIGTSTPSKNLVVTNASGTSQVSIDTSTSSPTNLLDVQNSAGTSQFKVSGTGTTSVAQLSTTTNSYVTVNNSAGNLALTPLGWDFLGDCQITGSPAASCANLTIAARDELMIVVRITGYGGSDIASLRFNADTGNNYNSRYLISQGTGVTTLLNTQTLTTNFGRLFGVAQTTGRSAEIICSNFTTTEKLCSVNGLSGVGSVSTVLNLQFGGFSWVNTANQITSVQLITQGASTMLVGSGVMVYGRNF